MKQVFCIFMILNALNLAACGRATKGLTCDEIDASMTAKQMKLSATVSTQAETEAVFGTPSKTSAEEDEYDFPGCKTYWTVFSDGKFLALASK